MDTYTYSKKYILVFINKLLNCVLGSDATFQSFFKSIKYFFKYIIYLNEKNKKNDKACDYKCDRLFARFPLALVTWQSAALSSAIQRANGTERLNT